ncbi:MAG: hypothetical protein ABI980_14080, partial [Nitrospirota bacterium]
FAPRSSKGRSTSQARWRRTWTRLACAQADGLAVRSVNRLLGTGALLLGDCPRPESNGTGTAVDDGASPQAPRACLAGRLRDFATNRHE